MAQLEKNKGIKAFDKTASSYPQPPNYCTEAMIDNSVKMQNLLY